LPFHIVSGNLQEPFPQFALTAPILQEKPSSPFNSTDLHLVEIPLPDLTISSLVYIWGRPAEQQPSTMWKEGSTWTL
jgi:hypothetical protein